MGLNREQQEENEIIYSPNIFHYFKMAAPSRVDEDFFSSGALAVLKECKIIILKYTGKTCRLYLLYSSASKNIFL